MCSGHVTWQVYQDQLAGQGYMGTLDRPAHVDIRERRESKDMMDDQALQDQTDLRERKVQHCSSHPVHQRKWTNTYVQK